VEVLAIVERVVLFEDAILDQFLFLMQTFDAVSSWNLEAAKGIFYLVSSWSFLRTSALDILVCVTDCRNSHGRALRKIQ
jgi:hypothetical protein